MEEYEYLIRDLNAHVERLFAGYRDTDELKELKAEILGNLEARMADYIDGGMPPDQALSMAKRSLDSVEDLLPGRKATLVNRFYLELLQTALLYTLIAWLLTIPARLLPSGIVANTVLALLLLVLGVLFLRRFSRTKGRYGEAVALLDLKKLRRCRLAAWVIWAIYLVLQATLTTFKYFGSDLWFGRPPQIGGPHQFAVIALSYALPLITVITPLLFDKACALAGKYEGEIQ